VSSRLAKSREFVHGKAAVTRGGSKPENGLCCSTLSRIVFSIYTKRIDLETKYHICLPYLGILKKRFSVFRTRIHPALLMRAGKVDTVNGTRHVHGYSDNRFIPAA
jgi:hypothetical protein